jgi:hypothetical protein
VVHSDAPYVEIQPDRYTFQGLAPVAGWGIVPASCCVAQAISTREDTLLLMDSGELLLAHPQIQPGSPRPRRHFEHVRGARLVAGSRLIYDRDGVPVAVVDAASFRALSCELSSGVGLAPTCNVSAHATTPVDFGTIHGAVRAEPRQAPGAATTLSEATAVFVASERGLFRCMLLLERRSTVLVCSAISRPSSRSSQWLPTMGWSLPVGSTSSSSSMRPPLP